MWVYFHSFLLSTCEKPFHLETQMYQSLEYLTSVFQKVTLILLHFLPASPMEHLLDLLGCWTSQIEPLIFLFIVSYIYLCCDLFCRTLLQVCTNGPSNGTPDERERGVMMALNIREKGALLFLDMGEKQLEGQVPSPPRICHTWNAGRCVHGDAMSLEFQWNGRYFENGYI